MKKHPIQNKFNFGCGLTLGFNLILVLTCHILAKKSSAFLISNVYEEFLRNFLIPELLGFGLIQYLYLGPIMVWNFAQEKDQLVYGILTASLITLAMNAVLFVLIIISLGNFSYLGF